MTRLRRAVFLLGSALLLAAVSVGVPPAGAAEGVTAPLIPPGKGLFGSHEFRSSLKALPKGSPAEVKIGTWKYGEVAEILHVGRYDKEEPTVEKLKKFIADKGYVNRSEALRDLIRRCHESPQAKRDHRRRAWQLYRSLVDLKVVDKKAEELKERDRKAEQPRDGDKRAEKREGDERVKLFIEKSSVAATNVHSGSTVKANVQYTLLASSDARDITITETRILSNHAKTMELDKREIVREQGTYSSTIFFPVPEDMPRGYCILYTTISDGKYSRTTKSVLNII